MKKQVKLEKILSHDIYSFWNETDWSTRRMFYIMLYVYSDFCKTPTYISPPKSVEDTEYTLREEIKQKKYYISQLAHETEEPNLCDVLSMCIDKVLIGTRGARETFLPGRKGRAAKNSVLTSGVKQLRRSSFPSL